MKLYRIYTENKHRTLVEEEVSHYFTGFTIYEAKGFWEGKSENTLLVEVLANVQEEMVKRLCANIKIVNEQESVLLTVQEVETKFI